MKRLGLAIFVLIGVSVAVVFSGSRTGVGTTFFPTDTRNPVTHLRWNDDPAEFQFAIVSDRTGGHRAEIFSQAVDKLNLMQPSFVLSVGDLIEGGAKSDKALEAEWKEIESYTNKLTMPFFYVPGNHDAYTKQAAKVWESKFGRRHYHFVYRNVLFLILNSNDPAGTVAIGKDQLAYADKVLKDNAGVAWTIVAVHHPLWNAGGAKNGWADVEKSLMGRNYTVFCGHVHRYQKFGRQGMYYYQLATTGGGSKLRGVEYGEFDHFVWVTMKKDGPLMANILIDSVLPENLQKIKTGEKGVSTASRKATHPVRGFAYFEGAAMPGAVVTFAGIKGSAANGINAAGVGDGDGSFKLSTYTAFDGAPAGEYEVGVVWREDKTGPSLLPTKYNTAAKSGLRATVNAGGSDVVLELKK